MDWFHCNNCYVQPDDNETHNFYVTNCGHLYCNNCVAKAHGTCLICKTPCRTLSLASQLDPTIGVFFKDWNQMIDHNNQEIKKVMRFQSTNHNRLLRFHVNKNKELCKNLDDAHAKIACLEKEIMSLKQQTSYLKQKERSNGRNVPGTPFSVVSNNSTSNSMSLLRGRLNAVSGSSTPSPFETPMGIRKRINMISPPENGRIGNVQLQGTTSFNTTGSLDLRFQNINRNLTTSTTETEKRKFPEALLVTNSKITPMSHTISATESHKVNPTPIGLKKTYQSSIGQFRSIRLPNVFDSY